MKKKKVLMAMSGGVDSSVAAALLLEQGYEVTGATMQIWPTTEESSCCSLTAVEDARKVASKLGIPYFVFNFKDIFKEEVIEYFIKEYLEGKTPNPCIFCNRYIKFEHLLNKALSMDMDYIATGHYARTDFIKGRYLLKKSKSKNKDQTYVLYNLTQKQLSHTLFPVGEYDKKKIRKIAKKLGFLVASKPDSQDICFIEDNDYGNFISKNSTVDIEKGKIVNREGEIIGEHKGLTNYTIGQRKGIGISAKEPLYVVDIDFDNNILIVGKESDIYSDELVATDTNLISLEKLLKPMKVKAKIRYGAKEAKAIITPLKNGDFFVKFKKKQRAITPGQSVVFYKGSKVVGGGIIKK
jgi:tRNA-uridine 2-sulfurtransferase